MSVPDWYSRRHANDPFPPIGGQGTAALAAEALTLDRHRVVTCTAFRRLEGKSQLFAPSRHDHFRTRLTHTVEVAHVARSLASRLGAGEALAEVMALAHDLGHPPFGHAGEFALNEQMSSFEGFNHNTHALRVVEFLEHPFPGFRGLNLTRAVLHGLAVHETKYDQPLRPDQPRGDESHQDLPGPGLEWPAGGTGMQPPESRATPDPRNWFPEGRGPEVEARVASLADRFAYNLHDLEDAIGAGLIGDSDLSELKIWNHAVETASKAGVTGPLPAIRRPVLDMVLRRLLENVTVTRPMAGTAETGETPDSREPIVILRSDVEIELQELEEFLYLRVYRHPEVCAADERGKRVVRELFAALIDHPSSLPRRFADRIPRQGAERVVADYVAGMTDRFCLAEHQRWCGQGARKAD